MDEVEVLKNKNHELEEQIKKMKSDFLLLKEKIIVTDQLIEQLHKKNQENVQLRSEKMNLFLSLKSLQTDFTKLTSDNKELLLKCKPLEEENEKLSAECQRLQFENKSNEMVIKQLNASESLKKDEILKLKAEIASLNKKQKNAEKNTTIISSSSSKKSKYAEPIEDEFSDSDSSMIDVECSNFTTDRASAISKTSFFSGNSSKHPEEIAPPGINPSYSNSLSQEQTPKDCLNTSVDGKEVPNGSSSSSRNTKIRKQSQKNASGKNKTSEAKKKKNDNEMSQFVKSLEMMLVNHSNEGSEESCDPTENKDISSGKTLSSPPKFVSTKTFKDKKYNLRGNQSNGFSNQHSKESSKGRHVFSDDDDDDDEDDFEEVIDMKVTDVSDKKVEGVKVGTMPQEALGSSGDKKCGAIEINKSPFKHPKEMHLSSDEDDNFEDVIDMSITSSSKVISSSAIKESNGLPLEMLKFNGDESLVTSAIQPIESTFKQSKESLKDLDLSSDDDEDAEEMANKMDRNVTCVVQLEKPSHLSPAKNESHSFADLNICDQESEKNISTKNEEAIETDLITEAQEVGDPVCDKESACEGSADKSKVVNEMLEEMACSSDEDDEKEGSKTETTSMNIEDGVQPIESDVQPLIKPKDAVIEDVADELTTIDVPIEIQIMRPSNESANQQNVCEELPIPSDDVIVDAGNESTDGMEESNDGLSVHPVALIADEASSNATSKDGTSCHSLPPEDPSDINMECVKIVSDECADAFELQLENSRKGINGEGFTCEETCENRGQEEGSKRTGSEDKTEVYDEMLKEMAFSSDEDDEEEEVPKSETMSMDIADGALHIESDVQPLIKTKDTVIGDVVDEMAADDASLEIQIEKSSSSLENFLTNEEVVASGVIADERPEEESDVEMPSFDASAELMEDESGMSQVESSCGNVGNDHRLVGDMPKSDDKKLKKNEYAKKLIDELFASPTKDEDLSSSCNENVSSQTTTTTTRLLHTKALVNKFEENKENNTPSSKVVQDKMKFVCDDLQISSDSSEDEMDNKTGEEMVEQIKKNVRNKDAGEVKKARFEATQQKPQKEVLSKLQKEAAIRPPNKRKRCQSPEPVVENKKLKIDPSEAILGKGKGKAKQRNLNIDDNVNDRMESQKSRNRGGQMQGITFDEFQNMSSDDLSSLVELPRIHSPLALPVEPAAIPIKAGVASFKSVMGPTKPTATSVPLKPSPVSTSTKPPKVPLKTETVPLKPATLPVEPAVFSSKAPKASLKPTTTLPVEPMPLPTKSNKFCNKLGMQHTKPETSPVMTSSKHATVSMKPETAPFKPVKPVKANKPAAIEPIKDENKAKRDFAKNMMMAAMSSKVNPKNIWITKWKKKETSLVDPWVPPFILSLIDYIRSTAQNHGQKEQEFVDYFLSQSAHKIINDKQNIEKTPVVSLCCVVVALMRIQGNMERVRMLLYEVLRNSCESSRICTVVMTICAVWPQSLMLNNGARNDFSSVQQVLRYYVMTSIKYQNTEKCFIKQLCGWEEVEQSPDEVISKLFQQIEQFFSQSGISQDVVSKSSWELQMAVMLLCSREGWDWTSAMVSKFLWPFLGAWANGNSTSDHFVQLVIDSLGICLSQYLEKIDSENFIKVFDNLKLLVMQNSVSLDIRESALRSVLRLSHHSSFPCQLIPFVNQYRSLFSEYTHVLLGLFNI